jgi:glutathione S-transferase
MALQLGALRDALISAGADVGKAAKAAEELAGYENRLAGIDTRLTVLTWAVGATATLLVAIGAPMLWLLLRVASKVGAL